MADTPDAVREYLAEIGRRGGSSRSAKKQRSSRRNARKYKTEAERLRARAESNRRYWLKKQKEKREARNGSKPKAKLTKESKLD
jgi:hypothetical protein